ncbi:hypothetical protein FF38_06425 [Lucilia cuprina]|uniref:Uncharacterized protein n=1 Tax=Lucilia cuprina TaxID=7375 RepID=A0A0L0CBI4_LUCCU|nr:hypothetical protein FF38_06425 [Lucilia cuprina]
MFYISEVKQWGSSGQRLNSSSIEQSVCTWTSISGTKIATYISDFGCCCYCICHCKNSYDVLVAISLVVTRITQKQENIFLLALPAHCQINVFFYIFLAGTRLVVMYINQFCGVPLAAFKKQIQDICFKSAQDQWSQEHTCSIASAFNCPYRYLSKT